MQSLRRRILLIFGRPAPSSYIPHQRNVGTGGECLNVGYLLIEYIEEDRGRMLSSTWSLTRDDVKLRANFCHDLCRIYLSLSRAPLPRIGSFVIDNNGFLRLNNHPLSLGIQGLENERIPTDIPRDYTYSTVDSYVMDTLSFHDSRLRNQPNAINDLSDYIYQTSALITMQVNFPFILSQGSSPWAFYFLTDRSTSKQYFRR